MKEKERKDPAKLAAENEDYSEDALLRVLRRKRKEREDNAKKS